MDKVTPQVQERDVVIIRKGKDQTVCTCDGSLPQLDGKSIVPTCAKCGGRIIRFT